MIALVLVMVVPGAESVRSRRDKRGGDRSYRARRPSVLHPGHPALPPTDMRRLRDQRQRPARQLHSRYLRYWTLTGQPPRANLVGSMVAGRWFFGRFLLPRIPRRCRAREQRHRLVDVPPGRRGPCPEPGRELVERFAFPQVHEHEQGAAVAGRFGCLRSRGTAFVRPGCCTSLYQADAHEPSSWVVDELAQRPGHHVRSGGGREEDRDHLRRWRTSPRDLLPRHVTPCDARERPAI